MPPAGGGSPPASWYSPWSASLLPLFGAPQGIPTVHRPPVRGSDAQTVPWCPGNAPRVQPKAPWPGRGWKRAQPRAVKRKRPTWGSRQIQQHLCYTGTIKLHHKYITSTKRDLRHGSLHCCTACTHPPALTARQHLPLWPKAPRPLSPHRGGCPSPGRFGPCGDNQRQQLWEQQKQQRCPTACPESRGCG